MKANPFFVDAFKHLNTKYEVCSPGEFAICEREKVNMKDIVLSGEHTSYLVLRCLNASTKKGLAFIA